MQKIGGMIEMNKTITAKVKIHFNDKDETIDMDIRGMHIPLHSLPYVYASFKENILKHCK